MRAYSVDLRERVTTALRTGKHTTNQVARMFGISRSAAQSYERQERKTGTLQPLGRGSYPNAACNDPLVQAAIIAKWEENNDATLAEYCRAVKTKCDVVLSESRMCRILKKLDLRRKKNGVRVRTRHAASSSAT